MERLLVYLAVAVAVFLALSAARLGQQPDYCGEARRLAAAVLAVSKSGGWLADTYLLDGVEVSSMGVFHKRCGVAVEVTMANETTLTGRWRLVLNYVEGKVYIVHTRF